MRGAATRCGSWPPRPPPTRSASCRPLRGLARSTATLADLAADDAAVAAVGSRAPLAAALLALEEPAPERVDHLLGQPPARIASAVLAGAVLAVGALLAVAVCHVVLPDHPGVPAWLLPIFAAPAVIAGRAAAYR